MLSRPFQLDMLFEDLRARCIDITDKNMPTVFHVPTKIWISAANQEWHVWANESAISGINSIVTECWRKTKGPLLRPLVTFNGSWLSVVRNISTHICASYIFEIFFFQNTSYLNLFFFYTSVKLRLSPKLTNAVVFTIPTTSEKTEDGESYVVTNSIILSFSKMSPFGRWKIKNIDGMGM